jgi:hypothetical protein
MTFSLPEVRFAVIVGLLAHAGCAGRTPTAPGPACRTWMLRYSNQGGPTFRCEARPLEPSCSAFPVNVTVTWTYQSHADFLHEADVPNRVRALRRQTTGCGTFVTTGCSHSLVEYAYDAQGRLRRRERSSSHSLGGARTIDVVTYAAWDRRGRPTQGVLEADGARVPLSIVYDDPRRIAQASNGELVEQDRHGNVIREVQLSGGRTVLTQYAIEAVQQVCEEGA